METGVMENLLEFYKKSMRLEEMDARTYSPLVLAYIGDAVYEVMVRTKVINGGSIQVNKLHKHSSRLVCAKAQADMVKLLVEELSEEERAVFKRGRNAKSVTTAKNASVADYRWATGFEALVGWLFLSEQFERLIELVSHGLEKIGEFDQCDTKN
ncbi:MAG: ribonuclease III domain-containing protein [Lachnospiraceae bacterium]|nr:ribonuclease III domain-containing protein [Lachnospiraceae bacterium]